MTPRLLETDVKVLPTMPVLSSQKGTLDSQDSTPGASMRQETRSVTRRMEAYLDREVKVKVRLINRVGWKINILL